MEEVSEEVRICQWHFIWGCFGSVEEDCTLKSLVVGNFVLLRFLLLLGRNNLQKYAIICPATEFMKKNIIVWKCLKNRLKLGISWQIKEGKCNDKSTFHLPRQECYVLYISWHSADTLWHRFPKAKCETTIRLRMRKGKTTFSRLSLKSAEKSLKSVSNKGNR